MDYSQRRREQAKRTEQAILRAAVELLRRNQFDKVSVRDICREAGRCLQCDLRLQIAPSRRWSDFEGNQGVER